MKTQALNTRFSRAIALAEAAHAGQHRKGTDLPYILHPLAVASLVIEYGGDEDQAIAGVLHDVIEDGGRDHAEVIRREFGAHVLNMVLACTDGSKERKARARTPGARQKDWNRRKRDYLRRLADESADALLVTACDKLHNVRAICADLEAAGPTVFDRFTAGYEGTLWYYGAVCDVLVARKAAPASTLAAEVARLRERAEALVDPLPQARELTQRLDAGQRKQWAALINTLEAKAQRAEALATRALGELSAHQQALQALRLHATH